MLSFCSVLLQPRFSLVIPVYDQQKHLLNVVASIQRQTFKNFEIVFVDDGSTDESLQIIQGLSQKYDNIVILKHEKNLGTLHTRTDGALSANGEYVIQFDPDDRFTTDDALQQLDEQMHESYDIYHFKENRIYNGEAYEFTWQNPKDIYLHNEQILDRVLNGKLSYTVHGKSIKRGLYTSLKNMFGPLESQHIIYSEDFFMILGLSINAKSYKGLNVVAYDYYMNTDSVMGDMETSLNKSIKYITDSNIIYQQCYHLTNSSLIFDRYLDVIWFFNQQTKLNYEDKFQICQLVLKEYVKDYERVMHETCGFK
ncbi:Glycosyl_transferase family 2 protein [Hexamita inflata]|uniref:Glycosyl transferase family 2 protein n=1 Tax=Hexamita inflata TaxID=28002 RepID=A0AA86P392_9EUKA|nr:Glycosyl transferase family 2 protein [Hexamita inflata]